MFSRLEVSMVLMEVFVVFCKWNLFFVVVSSNGTSLCGRSPNTENENENVMKIL